jgi:hypothetical protein
MSLLTLRWRKVWGLQLTPTDLHSSAQVGHELGEALLARRLAGSRRIRAGCHAGEAVRLGLVDLIARR